MRRFAAIDSGKYETKACLKTKSEITKKIQFKTKMDDTMEDKASDTRSCVVEFEGRKVILGEEAETVDYDKSKAKDIHKIATYAAIAQLVDDGDEVGVAIGCPLSIFFNVKERNNYKNFMLNKGKTIISLNNKTKSFTVDSIKVLPEGSGIIYKNPNKYKDRLVGIIDIGGLNSNCCIYDKLIPLKSTYVTTNLGANVMRNELMQKLNSAFPEVNLQEWHIEDIISKGYIKSHKEESKAIISDFIQKHVQKIIKACETKGWDIKNIDLVFVGGGSLLFEEEIKTLIPDAEISPTAQWDNVEGFAEIGAIGYEQ